MRTILNPVLRALYMDARRTGRAGYQNATLRVLEQADEALTRIQEIDAVKAERANARSIKRAVDRSPRRAETVRRDDPASQPVAENSAGALSGPTARSV